ncbi:MAG: 50S ribosomal protein L4 [Candidatus Saccharibacteria bacterium]|nr:50S ribosomal protein L4 [Candidatus Saccharibacteria bacterium]
MADAKLNDAVFAVEVPNHELLKLAYDAYLANGRQVSATTKTRGDVRGGGKKPWRQKGTGRARVGSSRNPIWRGGGVVFGPLGIENYTKNLSKASKRVALRQALTLANQAGEITVIDKFETNGKTKEAVAMLKAAKLADKRRVLLVDVKSTEKICATANLQNVELISPTYLTVYHILNADAIVFTKEALAATTEWLKEDK